MPKRAGKKISNESAKKRLRSATSNDCLGEGNQSNAGDEVGQEDNVEDSSNDNYCEGENEVIQENRSVTSNISTRTRSKTTTKDDRTLNNQISTYEPGAFVRISQNIVQENENDGEDPSIIVHPQKIAMNNQKKKLSDKRKETNVSNNKNRTMSSAKHLGSSKSTTTTSARAEINSSRTADACRDNDDDKRDAESRRNLARKNVRFRQPRTKSARKNAQRRRLHDSEPTPTFDEETQVKAPLISKRKAARYPKAARSIAHRRVYSTTTSTPKITSTLATSLFNVEQVNSLIDSGSSNVELNESFDNDYNEIGFQAHSTENCEINRDNQGGVRSNDNSIDRLAQVLENTLNAMSLAGQTSMNNDNTLLVHRMTTKSLPKFDGNPLEFPRFKQAIELSTNLGQFTSEENWQRLNDALTGKAREATQSLFVTKHSTDEIMRTLEMRFGNSKIVLHAIIDEIKSLPPIYSKKMNLVEFSTRLKNAVTAIKSLDGNLGYLYSPELADGLISKIPNSLIQSYVEFATTDDGQTLPVLERVSEFLYKQAQKNIDAGIFDSSEIISKKSDHSNNPSRSHESHYKRVFTTTSTDFKKSSNDSRSLNKCEQCGRRNHRIENCRDFIKAPAKSRWRIIKSNRLCFNCFANDHPRDKCKKAHCKQCGRKHHELLHFTEKKDTSQISSSEVPNNMENSHALLPSNNNED